MKDNQFNKPFQVRDSRDLPGHKKCCGGTIGGSISDPPIPSPTGGDRQELPLSNKLISVRAIRKKGSKDTTGSLEVYPSMLVRKRDYSVHEREYYDMIARFGKKSRIGGSIRGKIDHFSNAARFRMLKQLGAIGRQDPPYMVTLTYRSGSVTFDQAKKDLKKLRSRLDREFGVRHETTEEWINKAGFHKLRKRYKYEGKWAGVWRFEVTTGRGTRARGATPHFHILVWCDQWHQMNQTELDNLISQAWCEITGDGGEDRMKYGCDIKLSTGDQAKIKNYMLGHHGKKTDQEAIGAGKHWGTLNKELLSIGQPTETYQMNSVERNQFDRITRELIARRKGTESRDISDLKETHTVLSNYDTIRILDHLGISKTGSEVKKTLPSTKEVKLHTSKEIPG
jgi:hypothetical protein